GGFGKPMVRMSPKSLLRHKRAVSAAADFTQGRFHTILDDLEIAERKTARRVLLCSGKFAYTLLEARAERGVTETAVVRVEQLYPFPRAELIELFPRYPNARDSRGVQEEPANMGAGRGIRHRLEGVLPVGATLALVARKASPTPATGFYAVHAEEERDLLDRALAEVGAVPTR